MDPWKKNKALPTEAIKGTAKISPTAAYAMFTHPLGCASWLCASLWWRLLFQGSALPTEMTLPSGLREVEEGSCSSDKCKNTSRQEKPFKTLDLPAPRLSNLSWDSMLSVLSRQKHGLFLILQVLGWVGEQGSRWLPPGSCQWHPGVLSGRENLAADSWRQN